MALAVAVSFVALVSVIPMRKYPAEDWLRVGGENQIPDIVAPKKVVDAKNVPVYWETLIDYRNSFMIQYPYDLTPQKFANGISFTEGLDGMSLIGVQVFNTSDVPSSYIDTRHNKIETVVRHNNYTGIVTHRYDSVEEFPHEKTLRIERAGKTYLINTRGVDHDRVWASFRFVEKPFSGF